MKIMCVNTGTPIRRKENNVRERILVSISRSSKLLRDRRYFRRGNMKFVEGCDTALVNIIRKYDRAVLLLVAIYDMIFHL